ncbi:MAG TPA: hypothetical protein VGH90_04175 [Chthoniobacteraceae bacterium]|jgi:hypothetical protein
MNESEFENELRALRPQAPSEALKEAIARDLARPIDGAGVPALSAGPRERPYQSLLTGLCWALGGAAAAVAVMLSIDVARGSGSPRNPVPLHTEKNIEPPRASRKMVGAEIGGLVYGDDLAPNRVVRYSSVERRTWADPSGARVEMEVPREDVLLVPVSFQ